jgi:integrase
MALAMSRPIKDPSSGIYRMKPRVPADLAGKAKGKSITLPVGGAWSTVRVGEFVEMSLKTRDPNEAKIRHAAADAALRQYWEALRAGSVALSHKQATAIAGQVYRETIARNQNDTTNAALHEAQAFRERMNMAKGSKAQQTAVLRSVIDQHGLGVAALLMTKDHFEASVPNVSWDALLENTFGKSADAVLTREGLVIDNDSRRLLLKCVRDAAIQANAVVARNSKGDYSPDPDEHRFPPISEAKNATGLGLTITGLLAAYLKELQSNDGRGKAAEKRWTPIFKAFAAFLNHDEASRVRKVDVVAWKEHRLGLGRAPRTIRDNDIASLRAVFEWAVDNSKLPLNPVAGVKIKVMKQRRNRDPGFSDDEAWAILKASIGYQKPEREYAETGAAKRWTPWLCAFTGARISEMCQLRKEDVLTKDGIEYIRLTPEAGSIKSNDYRDVPLHPQIIEQGFLDFVNASRNGPLFHRTRPRKGSTANPAESVGKTVGEWVGGLKVVEVGIQPNYGWRHRFKTITTELDIKQRIIDAIQDHAPRTAGDRYGDVTLKAKAEAINKLPRYLV